MKSLKPPVDKKTGSLWICLNLFLILLCWSQTTQAKNHHKKVALPTYVQSNSANVTTSATTISAAYSGAQSAGNTNLVYIFTTGELVTGSSPDFISGKITDTAGNYYAIAGWVTNGNHPAKIQGWIYVCIGIKASASNSVTANFTQSSPTQTTMIVAEYSGVAYLSTGAPGFNGAANTAINAGNCTTVTNNELVIGFCQAQNTISSSNGTIRLNTLGFALADLSAPTPGSYALTFVASANSFWQALSISVSGTIPATNGRALIPPLGWDSWRLYGLTTTETNAHAQANALISLGLNKLGYTNFSISGVLYNSRDGNGNLVTNTTLFPSGDTALYNFIKSLGLTPAGYLGPSTVGCGSFPGSQGHETADAIRMANAGMLWVMYDSCTDFGSQDATRSQYLTMQQALDATGASMLMLTSAPIYEGGCFGGLQFWTPSIASNIAVTSPDYQTPITWAKLTEIIDNQIGLGPWMRPGRLNWADWLPTGNGTLTDAEGRTAFAFWCLNSFPVFVGCDLTAITTPSLTTISNAEIIAIDQDPLVKPAYLISRTSAGSAVVDVWAKALQNGKMAVQITNRDAATQSGTFTLAQLGLAGSSYVVRDLFNHSNQVLLTQSGSYSAAVDSHNSAMLSLSPPPVSGAVYIQGTSLHVAGAASVSQPFSSNVTAGDAIVVSILFFQTDGVGTVSTTQGDNFTFLYSDPVLSSGFNVGIWMCASAHGGATSVTYTSGTNGSNLAAAEFSSSTGFSLNLDGAAQHVEGANTLPAINTTNPIDLILIAGWVGSVTSIAGANGFNVPLTPGSGNLSFLGYLAPTSLGTYTPAISPTPANAASQFISVAVAIPSPSPSLPVGGGAPWYSTYGEGIVY